MKDRMSDLWDGLIQDEPPLRTGVDDIVLAGRRARRRRQRGVAAAVVASAAALAVLAMIVPSLRGSGTTLDPILPAMPSQAATASDPFATPSGTSPANTRSANPPRDSGDPTAARSSDAGPPSGHSSGPAPAGGTRQWLADPGMEATTLGWTPFGHGPQLARVGGARTGRYALRATSTAAYPITAGATSHPARAITSAGTTYTASCWVRSDTKIEAIAQVQEYTTDWARVSDPVKSPKAQLTDPAQWYELRVTYTATAAGNLLPLTVFSPELGTPGNAALIIDDCSLTG